MRCLLHLPQCRPSGSFPTSRCLSATAAPGKRLDSASIKSPRGSTVPHAPTKERAPSRSVLIHPCARSGLQSGRWLSALDSSVLGESAERDSQEDREAATSRLVSSGVPENRLNASQLQTSSSDPEGMASEWISVQTRSNNLARARLSPHFPSLGHRSQLLAISTISRLKSASSPRQWPRRRTCCLFSGAPFAGILPATGA